MLKFIEEKEEHLPSTSQKFVPVKRREGEYNGFYW